MAGVIGAVAAVVGAGSSVYSASRANKGNTIAQNAADEAAQRADPAAAERPWYQDYLHRNFMGLASTDPSQIMNDPSFRFLHDQGMRDIDNKASSDGTLRSGTVLEDMSRFNQDLSSQYIQQQFSRNMALMGQLGNFSGLNIGNPGVAGQVTMQGGLSGQNTYNSAISQIGGAANALGRAFGGTGATSPTTFPGAYPDSGGGPAYG